jgi:putative transposase
MAALLSISCIFRYYYTVSENGCKGKMEHMYGKSKGQSYYKNRHSCFLLQYHMVLVTKYRHPVLTGAVKDLVYRTIRDIFEEKGLVILEMNGEPDHIHILYEADPFISPGGLVNIVKTKTSRFARKQYGDTVLKKYYWKPLFWSDSYFVATVSENSVSIVQEYIQNQ